MSTSKAAADSVQLRSMDCLAWTGMRMQPVTAFSSETLNPRSGCLLELCWGEETVLIFLQACVIDKGWEPGSPVLSPCKGLFQAIRSWDADTQTPLQWKGFAWVGVDRRF